MQQTPLNELFGGDFIPVLMAPTATGKSELAMRIAEQYNGEIITADSMQLYKGLDIGTAKATPEEQRRVPRHLIDILHIQEKADVFRYCELAEQAVRDIRSRGKRPVIEGGSGLYIHAFLYGLDTLPARQELRDELDSKYDNAEHFCELQAIMQEKCPADFAKFSLHRRKLIRAYEVYLLTGQQMTSLQTDSKSRPPRPGFREFFLTRDRDELKSRIRLRTGQMLASGWIEEARDLIAMGLLSTPTAWQALGYSLIGEYLENKLTYPELEEKISIATWQYARRQLTWFRNRHPNAVRIEM